MKTHSTTMLASSSAVAPNKLLQKFVRHSLRLEGCDNADGFEVLEDGGGLLICTVERGVATDGEIKLRWELPAAGVKGVWTSQALHEKRLRADWEAPDCNSQASVEAPVVSVFGHDDSNIVTFACSNAVNTTSLAAPIREEDNLLHCSVSMFREPKTVSQAPIIVRIDLRNCGFSESLSDMGHWWESVIGYSPMSAPIAAKMPVYSTWYAFHQSLQADELLQECEIGKRIGLDTIIVDDGWQTLDSNRGYDYTGDWEPVRMTELRAFTDAVHEIGMKAMLWYSVPFVGVKSKAYHRFNKMLLTKEHRWAPVFDPRYPEVRSYLISKYEEAIRDWGFDGLKLDFIDDFRNYEATPQGIADGRDFASVNDAVEELLKTIREALTRINPNVLIEFRQRYNGPVVRQNANMLRAFDCPADSVTNRIRTTDLRLLGTETAIHSDMLTWHPDSALKVAALQISAVLFSVPQISIRLASASSEELRMIQFYMEYYRNNFELLLDAPLRAYQPLENYPLLEVSNEHKKIVGSYSSMPIVVDAKHDMFDIINGTLKDELLIHVQEELSEVDVKAYDLLGDTKIVKQRAKISQGYHSIPVPAGGILSFSFR